MKINDVIQRKGADVVTISPDATVRELVDLLRQHRIGAVVVSTDGTGVHGLVSERDVAQNLRTGIEAEPVSAIMTGDVITCSPDDEIEAVARTMTENRVRHIPVVVNGSLHAIISIGDVVKFRIDQLTDERDQLVQYLHG